MIYNPANFPDPTFIDHVEEPIMKTDIFTPKAYLGGIMQLATGKRGFYQNTEYLDQEMAVLHYHIPLIQLIVDFYDKLKSVSSGYASISYEIGEMRDANVTRLDILVADEIIPAFSRVVSRRKADEEAEKAVEKLHEILPRQLFVMKIQGKALGRIVSSRTVQAYRKDVTGYLYGGDITRKKKLWEKQKKGKKKMKERGKVNIPQDVFLKMMRSGVE